MRAKATSTLLLVEDNPGDARLFYEMLHEGTSAIEIKHVHTLSEAEAELSRSAPDIILLDLGLSDAQGLAAVRRAHAAAPQIPLVVLTGLNDETLALQTLHEGAQDYLVKGQIDTRGLLRSLRYAMERNKLESALLAERKRSEDGWIRLAAIHETTPDMVCISDPRGALVYMNPGGRTMLGLDPLAEIRQLTLSGISANATTPFIADEAILTAVREGIWRGETELVRGDGRPIALSQVVMAHKRPDGSVEFLSTIATDISERKRAEAQLRLQGAALNATESAIVITGRDLATVWCNPAFTRLTGYPRDEAIGRNPQELLDSGVHDSAFHQQILETILAGRTWRGEMTNRRKDGSLYPEAQAITPVRNDDGTIGHFISIKADLTAQRQLEAQLRQSQKMEAVGQLAAGMAHEFNNLLQALMSMAAIVRLRAGNPEIGTIAAEMEFQIKRGASITGQLLLFSGRNATEKSTIDLLPQIQKASVLLRRLLKANISIAVDTSSGTLFIEGEVGQLQQILLNLAINARDAMPGGGTLTLRAGSRGEEVFLEVEDTGRGISEAARSRLFEPFFTTKEAGGGTGLGLAVVHRIVEEHGGRIEVESRWGQGSLFRVLFPAAAPKLPLPGKSEDILPGSGRVLLVEDETGVRTAVAALLAIIGYEVIAVGSAEEAMAIPPEPAPDLLLSDISLPGLAGGIMADRLCEQWPELKVVLMSGYIGDSQRLACNERGWLFLQKPFETVDLASQMRSALEGTIPAPVNAPALSPSA